MIFQSLFGFAALAALAWVMSENRWKVPWRTVGAGIGLQVVLAICLLRIPAFRGVFVGLNHLMEALTNALDAGTSFVFGYVGGGAAPFEVTSPEHSYIFAFRALPLLLLISALSALLFYWRVLPLVVKAMSAVLTRTMRVGGAVGLSTAANVFMGMVEAPLLVAPYVARMSRGEVFILMTSGMATVAGTVMVLYANILSNVIPNALGNVISASLINAPAAIVVASLMVPPDEKATEADLVAPQQAKSTMDALSQGTEQGVRLLINVTAMLIVLVALISLINQALSLFPSIAGQELTMQRMLGFLLAPIAWLMGIPWHEAVSAGGLLGTKVVLNEFIAYVDLANLSAEALSPRSRLIMTYALCGFANFGSVGIMLGGLGTMVPEKRSEITSLGLKSIVSGALASCMTGTLIGIIAA